MPYLSSRKFIFLLVFFCFGNNAYGNSFVEAVIDVFTPNTEPEEPSSTTVNLCSDNSGLSDLKCEAIGLQWRLVGEYVGGDGGDYHLAAALSAYSSIASITDISGTTLDLSTDAETLPDIRQLGRLFNYAQLDGAVVNLGLARQKKWFESLRVKLTDGGGLTTITNGSAELQTSGGNVYDPYLLSSTVRHEQDSGIKQVLAIRVRTGAIVALRSDNLEFCTTIKTDATCSDTGKVRGEHQPVLAIVIKPIT